MNRGLQHGGKKNPPTTHTQDKPTKAIFDFLRRWGVISAIVVACGGGIWRYLEGSLVAPYFIALGLGGAAFLAAHNLFAGWTLRYAIPSFISLVLLIVAGWFVAIIEQRARWQPPELPKGTKVIHIGLSKVFDGTFPIERFRTNNRPIQVLMGTNITGVDVSNRIPIFVTIKRNRLYVTANIQSDDGSPIRIDFSRPPNLPTFWDAQVCNSAMEIINGKGTPVCQVIYSRPDKVDVRGVFTQNGQVGAFGENIVEWGYPPYVPVHLDLKPIFKYPSGLHPCEMAN